MPPDPEVKNWPIVSTRSMANYRIFSLRTDLKINPRTGGRHDFFVIECPDWVNVVAITPDSQLVMVEQFRHGTNTVELEVPGGVMDPQECDPVAAGQRELREETGFEGTAPRLIGCIYPNPAIQSNTCHTLLVEQCELRHPTEFDPSEDIQVRLIPLDTVPQLIASGRIRHSLVIVALSHYLMQRNQARGTPGP